MCVLYILSTVSVQLNRNDSTAP